MKNTLLFILASLFCLHSSYALIHHISLGELGYTESSTTTYFDLDTGSTSATSDPTTLGVSYDNSGDQLRLLVDNGGSFVGSGSPFYLLTGLELGDTVSSSQSYTGINTGRYYFYGQSNFSDGEEIYAGFQLPNGEYGWARISADLQNRTITLYEAAYEDSGAPIEVGAVPEPHTYASLLGAAAFGLAFWRRRRSA